MKKISIQLIPHLKIDEDDDYNALFQQGYNIRMINVEAGETFEISDDFEEAYVDCDGELIVYKYNDENFEEDFESDEQIALSPGKYKFLEDGITIINIED